jgi:hypothetical protein
MLPRRRWKNKITVDLEEVSSEHICSNPMDNVTDARIYFLSYVGTEG